MWKYILHKTIIFIVTLITIITITFILLRIAPGGPFKGEYNLPEYTRRVIENQYGLNKPIFTQYAMYLNNLLRFDFGISYSKAGIKVGEIIAKGFRYSGIIGVISFLISVTTGTFLGAVAAINKGKWIDKLL